MERSDWFFKISVDSRRNSQTVFINTTIIHFYVDNSKSRFLIKTANGITHKNSSK